MNTHHCPEVYLQEFAKREWRGAPILFRNEPVLLDTAGGLKNIEDLLEGDEAILCYNGDVLSDLPLERLLSFHEQKKPEATLALRSSGPFLHVSINERGEICNIRNILKDEGVQKCLFTGIYAIETSLLQHIERGVSSIIATFVQRISNGPGSVMGIVIDQGTWHDIGSVEEYEQLKKKTDTLEG